MQPVATLKTPTSAIRGFSSRFDSRQAGPSRFSAIPNGKQSIDMPVQTNLKPLRIKCVRSTERERSDGIEPLKKTLDNLAKLCAPSSEEDSEDRSIYKPIEKLIADDRVSSDSIISPKQKLGDKWREYQGCNNWAGLLDPLDENLRREIVKYGDFVQATYNAMEFDPRSEEYGCCKYSEHSLLEQAGLMNSGYNVTQHIHATSAIQIPEWVTQRFSSDGSDWMSRRTSWVGFVAVCNDEKEIARLGRRDIVVSYRGTVTPVEWAENLKDVLTPAVIKNKCKSKSPNSGRSSQPKVESGFWSLFTTKNPEGQSASDQVVNEVRRLVELYEGEEISITITGHSLGAALAVLTAYQIGQELNSDENAADKAKIPVTVFSFGGPRVGNRALGETMEETGCKVLRIVNTHDVITKVPGLVLNENSMQQQQRSKNVVVSKIFDVLDKVPWAYCHVGTELRVDNKHSPYLKPDADMNCCHDLEAYLHLVDGYLSSNCPFRATAKRDIVRLWKNQKSNVKPNIKAVFEHRYKDSSGSKSFSKDQVLNKCINS